MKMENYFRLRLARLQNENIKNSILRFATDRWFNLRISLLNCVLVQLPCYAILVYNLTGTIDNVHVAMTI